MIVPYAENLFYLYFSLGPSYMSIVSHKFCKNIVKKGAAFMRSIQIRYLLGRTDKKEVSR